MDLSVLTDIGARAFVAFLFSGLLALLGYYLRPKARIIYSALHQFRFVLPPPQPQPTDSDRKSTEGNQSSATPPTSLPTVPAGIPATASSPIAREGAHAPGWVPPQQPLVVSTQTLFVQNIGRGRADTVQVFLNFKPMHYAIWPVRQYTEELLPDGRFVIGVTNLNRWESFTVELLVIPEVPWIMGVRSEGGAGKEVELIHSRRLPTRLYVLLWALLFLGFSSCIFIALSGVAWLLK